MAFSPESPELPKRNVITTAKWNTGQSEASPAKELWLTGKKASLTPVTSYFSVCASGKQDPLAYLERIIRLAMKAGNTGPVIKLAGQMPADYQTIALAIIRTGEQP